MNCAAAYQVLSIMTSCLNTVDNKCCSFCWKLGLGCLNVLRKKPGKFV
jgi:hypothetical protein